MGTSRRADLWVMGQKGGGNRCGEKAGPDSGRPGGLGSHPHTKKEVHSGCFLKGSLKYV